MITAREDPVVFEVTATLREWHKIWISLYLDNQNDLFERIEVILSDLIDARAELISALKQNASQDATSKEQQINEFKTNIISKLDLGNRLLNLDLVPRDADFKVVDPIELSPIKLYQLHSDAASNPAGLSNTLYGCHDSIISASGISTWSSSSQISSDSYSPNLAQNSCHLQLSLRNHFLTSLPPDESVEIYFSIVDLNNSSSSGPAKPVTEKFLVQVKNDDLVCGVPNTIFTNLGSLNTRDACLLIQVYRVGKMTLVDGSKTFGKQQSSHNLQSTHQEGSTNSMTSTNNRYAPNGLSRSRHSTIGLPTNVPKYRRPFGTTVVQLKEFIRSAHFKEANINVKVVSTTNESDFSLSDLYTKRSHSMKLNQNQANIQLDLAIKVITCAQESLQKVATTRPYCLTEKRGFPDIVMPGDFKNDLFFTLESAEFEKGGKSISKNIEALISLRNKAGIPIANCISPGSNCDNVSTHESCVFYHCNSPKWHESVKINVPLVEFDSAHIRIEFRHCSTKEKDKDGGFLGFAFLPLSDQDGTVIADKSHELYLYKCDPQAMRGSLNLCEYTNLSYGPSSTIQSDSGSCNQFDFSRSGREVVIVSTFLLSTKLTQNSHLLTLLKWRELIDRKKGDFEEALKKVLDMKGEEIVKFLQDILDALFDTFALYSASGNDYTALIFKVLVHIFLLLDEPKYQHFKPVLDTYASAHFSATLVYKGLLSLVRRSFDYLPNVENHAAIQRCFKSIKYIFQFIVQSKLLYSKATGERTDETFLIDLRHLFKRFEAMLLDKHPDLIPIQVTFLESFPGALEQLIKVVSPQKLSKLVTSLVGNVEYRSPPALSKAKLKFMRETAMSEMVKNQDIRLLITENFCKHLDCYIKHSEELELCCEVLDTLIVKIHDSHWPAIHRIYQLTIKSLPLDSSVNKGSVMTVGEIDILTETNQIQSGQLDQAIASLSREIEPFIDLIEPLLILLELLAKDFNTERLIVQRYCTCLLTILKLMSKSGFEQFLKRRKFDYLKLCNLFRSFRGVYNRDWSVMQLTSHSILEHPIDEISKGIRTHNNNPPNRLLSSYIKLIVDFITHPTLQLETFSERKKEYVLSVFGDLRIKFSSQLIRFWADLKIINICDLIPTSIQSFLDVSMLPNDELQQTIIPVFWDMINAEDHYKSNSRQIERCLIDNLDLFMNLDRGNLKFIDNFERILKKMISDKLPEWAPRGLELINSFTKLQRLLLNYRQSMEVFENRSKQMCCLVELLNFYKNQDRLDLHLKYLFKLCDMHLELGNHVEAAFTLKLYTEEIKWCHRSLSVLDGYRPEEQEWRRKEVLYHRIIEYFDKGKCWEESISLCKELASFYENFLVDYGKVSSTLKKLAQFLDNILTEHRPEREYFRVEFIGLGMPEFVRGKEFIYRGGEYERLAAFIQRMTLEFPDAQVLSSKSKQSITHESPGQFMIISNVKPVPFLQEHLKSGHRNINDKIIQYYMNNRLDTFSYDVPIIKDGTNSKCKSKENYNVKNLWVGRYMLKLRRQLPDILPWSEVISQDYNEISPINHAIETISGMNLELSKLILSYRNEPTKQISPLTMRLQGVIEAAVNGGPSVFINAFLKRQPTNEPVSQAETELLIRLRDLIRQQFSILETGLSLHSKLVPPEVMPLHTRLVECLQNTRKTLLDDANQIRENNYEILNQVENVASRAIKVDSMIIPKNGVHELVAARDEVDHSDLNGNIYGEIDDQIYSQPTEPSTAKVTASNGTKSELSSPARLNYHYGTSSSLSALTVLSNMSVNRSRTMSMTPTKEVTSNQSNLGISTNELCARAARKLTYDSNRAPDNSKNQEATRLSPLSNGNSSSQDAPPLPPRSFVGDKHGSIRTLNRSPFLPPRTTSPSKNVRID